MVFTSSLSKVARVTAILLALCGTFVFAQSQAKMTVAATLPVGVVVSAVDDNSPALKAGIEVGDVILNVEGVPVYTDNDIWTAIYARMPGDTILVEVRHADITSWLDITLAASVIDPGTVDTYLGLS